MSMQSNNSQLHELVLHYLQQLDSNDARQLMDILRNFMTKHPGFEEGEVYYIDDEVENGTAKARLRRGSDWDAANSIYLKVQLSQSCTQHLCRIDLP